MQGINWQGITGPDTVWNSNSNFNSFKNIGYPTVERKKKPSSSSLPRGIAFLSACLAALPALFACLLGVPGRGD
jgi:hypothetical protein